MTISSHLELREFIETYFHQLTDAQYIDIISATLGIYESGKPTDLNQLLERIDSYGAYLETLPHDVELPLFWTDEKEIHS